MTRLVDPTSIANEIRRGRLSYLRVVWCDNSNTIRAKTLHLPSFLERLGPDVDSLTIVRSIEHSFTISQALQSLPVMYDVPVPQARLEPVRDVRLVPDWSTFSVLTHAPRHAQVMGDMVGSGDIAWECCPRDVLRRVELHATSLGYTVMVGAEVEFYLVDGDVDGEPKPVDRTRFASTAALARNYEIIDEISDSMFGQGVELDQALAESGPGQFELTLRFTAPLAMADRIIAARETIRAIATKHGYLASFAPSPLAGEAGSGGHIHLSIWQAHDNVTGDADRRWGVSDVAGSFIAGILDAMPALMAVTTPTTNSFRRIQPHAWVGAYRAWGVDNKEGAIRVVPDRVSGAARDLEFKTIDESSNPYLAIGSVIAAGLDGIRNRSVPIAPIEADPANLSEAEAKAADIARLPTDLGVVLDEFEGADVLRSAIGDRLSDVYLAVKRAEYAATSVMSESEERALFLGAF